MSLCLTVKENILNPSIYETSQTFLHTQTHTRLKPNDTTSESYFPDLLCQRSCAPSLRQHSQGPSFLPEMRCRGGKKRKRKTNKQVQRYGGGRTHKCVWQTPSELHIPPAHPCCRRVWRQHKRKELRKSRSGVTSPCLPHQWVIVPPPPRPKPPHSFPPPALYSQTLAQVPSDGESDLPHCQMRWNNWARLLKQPSRRSGQEHLRRCDNSGQVSHGIHCGSRGYGCEAGIWWNADSHYSVCY